MLCKQHKTCQFIVKPGKRPWLASISFDLKHRIINILRRENLHKKYFQVGSPKHRFPKADRKVLRITVIIAIIIPILLQYQTGGAANLINTKVHYVTLNPVVPNVYSPRLITETVKCQVTKENTLCVGGKSTNNIPPALGPEGSTVSQSTPTASALPCLTQYLKDGRKQQSSECLPCVPTAEFISIFL